MERQLDNDHPYLFMNDCYDRDVASLPLWKKALQFLVIIIIPLIVIPCGIVYCVVQSVMLLFSKKGKVNNG